MYSYEVFRELWSRAFLLVLVVQVTEYLKRQKDPDQLATLLQMLKCLLNNSHFAFLEIYVREREGGRERGGEGARGGGRAGVYSLSRTAVVV